MQSTKTDFDIIAILESRLIKDRLSPNDVSLINYSHVFCSTENKCWWYIDISKESPDI